jgi:MoxR-like ATPase
MDITNIQKLYNEIKKELGRVIVGQEEVIDFLLITIFSGGHALLVGDPGVAKTLMVKSLAMVLGSDFRRIQFTPDLMPGDILGSEILEEDKTEGRKIFRFVKGPIFANFILADEINRTPPKTQSALLEAMQERQVTINGQQYRLPEPFFVLATQNPIEQEGTYPLPEAQLDRFMCFLQVNYPTSSEESDIVKRTIVSSLPELNPVSSSEEVLDARNFISGLPVADNVVEAAVRLTSLTRPDNSENEFSQYIRWGAGPRASQFLVAAARVWGAFNGKLSPDVEDISFVARPVLTHRILTNFTAEAEGIQAAQIVDELVKKAANEKHR